MRRPMLLRAGLVVLAAALVCGNAHGAARESAALLFSPETYVDHVRYLASDALGGRLPGTPGIEAAAEYIAARFEDAGLEPAGDDGTWYQAFEVRRGKKLVEAEARLEFAGIDRAWTVGEDWIPLPFTDMDDVAGPLAFAGYGVEAIDHEYDDYADFDAHGKILLVLRYEPRWKDADENGRRRPSRHATFVQKARVAAAHGALGLLIVNPPNRPGGEEGLYPFSPWATEPTFALPMMHVTPELADTLLQHAGLPDLATLQSQLDGEQKPLSRDLGVQVTLATGVQPNRITARNVLGLLPGDGSTSETIVVGAHYDHLGLVPNPRSRDATPHIHNGADDNASGTAAVLELARALGRQGGLRRNVLFIAFSAEEMGLLGSKHFVAHPTRPLADMRAMVNFDMVGRLHLDRMTIFGIPTAGEFGELVRSAAQRWDIDYREARGLTGASDHAAFYRYDIPYLFPITGVHAQYHHPDDDWELIDAGGAVRIVAMFHEVIAALANLEEGPTFQAHEAGPDALDQMKRPAVEELPAVDSLGQAGPPRDGEPSGEAAAPRRPRAALGIMPDFSGGDEVGVRIEAVQPDGGAAAAGLKSGDRIVRIDGTEIKNIYGYMERLRGRVPGDVVDVVVVRDGNELTLKVELREAPGRRPPGGD